MQTKVAVGNSEAQAPYSGELYCSEHYNRLQESTWTG